MLGQTLVQESIIRIEQIEDTAVFPQNALEKQFGLLTECAAQAFIEIGKGLRIGAHSFEIPEMQPLPAEIADKGRRPLILQHPPNLLFQNSRVAQFFLFCQFQQPIIWNAAPEEKRESGSEIEIVQPVN